MKKSASEIFQEYLQLKLQGKAISLEELIKQYPEHKDLLLRKIAALDILPISDDKASPADDLVGRQIGDFNIIKRIGCGGMGAVYLAEQISLKRNVALKFLHSSIFANEKFLERFHREGQAIAKLEHKGIVPVYMVGQFENNFYIAMQYVRGLPLSKLIEHARNNNLNSIDPERIKELIAEELPDEDVDNIKSPPGKNWTEMTCSVVLSVADAVDYAHQEGIIHRDIKPSNIILTKEGQPVLLDFGLSKDVGAVDVTMSGELLGTPAYSSPEQLFGKHAKPDATMDVYALGMTLYELLTFNLPYEGDSIGDLLASIKTREPLTPKMFSHKLPKELETIILTAIRKEPSGRYRSVKNFLDDVNHFLNYEPIAAKPLNVLKRGILYLRRNKLKSILASVLIIILISGVYITLLKYKHGKEVDKLNIKAVLEKVLIDALNQDYQSAFEKVREAYKLNPQHPNVAAYYYGLKMYVDGSADDSIAEIDKLERKHPNNILLPLVKMIAYYEKKDIKKGNSIKNDIISRVRHDPIVRLIPLTLHLMNYKREAVEFSSIALEQYPNDGQLHYGMGILCVEELNDLKCAKEHYEKAAMLNPNRYLEGLGSFYTKIEASKPELQQMISNLEKNRDAAMSLPKTDYWYNLSILYYRAGECDKSLVNINKALNLDPQKNDYLVQQDKAKSLCK